MRGKIEAPTGADKDELERLARAEPRIAELLAGKQVIKVIALPNKMVSFVVK